MEYATNLSKAVKETPSGLLIEAKAWFEAALAKAAKDAEHIAIAKADPTASMATLDAGY